MPLRKLFKSAHASGADWGLVAKACVNRLGKIEPEDNLGFVYCTESLADHFSSIVSFLRLTTRIEHWVGAVGLGVCASGADYHGDGGLSVMVGAVPQQSFRILSTLRDEHVALDDNIRRWLAEGQTILGIVHGDPRNVRVPAIIQRLADDTRGFLVGGMTAIRSDNQQVADTLTGGGVSGVLLHTDVGVVVGMTQGCSPIGPAHQVTEAMANLVISLDDRPALDVLKEDIGEILARNLRRISGYIHAGLVVGDSDTNDYVVRSLIGIDAARGWLVIGGDVATGERLIFVRRDANSAQVDLRRMVTDLKQRADGRARGGLYFSCVGRGSHMFGEPGGELSLIAEALDNIPITGFYANGEINNNKLYTYTGVLALFL